MPALALALLLATLPAAQAPDPIVGLLALPEVFGNAPCDRFEPQEIALYATPDAGRPIGWIRSDGAWTFNPVGGCQGSLDVKVYHADTGTVAALPTREYAYEAPAAIVLDQRDRWFRIRLAEGSAWLRASRRDEYFPLEKQLAEGLTYLTQAWDGRLAPTPGGGLRGAARPPARRDDTSVRVLSSRRVNDALWIEVEIFSHSPCLGPDDPRVIDRGWVPAHAASGEPAVWFYSRGC